MDKQDLTERQRLAVRLRPGIFLYDHNDMIVQDIAASFLRKFMRLFIIEFYFNGCRQFEFTKNLDNSFEFKAFALNKWAYIKDGDCDGWIDAFCDFCKEKDWYSDCSIFLDLTLEDVIRDKDIVGFDYLPIAFNHKSLVASLNLKSRLLYSSSVD